MCDCGCGGKCGGNCGQPSKIITKELNTVTSNLFYKGSAVSCAGDSSIDIVDGEGFNSILQKILTKLCSVGSGGNLLSFSKTNLVHSNQPSTETLYSYSFPVGHIKAGEGIRLRYTGDFSANAAGSGITLKPQRYTVDSLGTPSAKTPMDLRVISAGVSENFIFEFTLLRDETDPTILWTDVYVRTYNSGSIGTINYTQYAGQAIYNDLDTNGISFDFEVTSTHASDVIRIQQLTIEHLKA